MLVRLVCRKFMSRKEWRHHGKPNWKITAFGYTGKTWVIEMREPANSPLTGIVLDITEAELRAVKTFLMHAGPKPPAGVREYVNVQDMLGNKWLHPVAGLVTSSILAPGEKAGVFMPAPPSGYSLLGEKASTALSAGVAEVVGRARHAAGVAECPEETAHAGPPAFPLDTPEDDLRPEYDLSKLQRVPREPRQEVINRAFSLTTPPPTSPVEEVKQPEPEQEPKEVPSVVVKKAEELVNPESVSSLIFGIVVVPPVGYDAWAYASSLMTQTQPLDASVFDVPVKEVKVEPVKPAEVVPVEAPVEESPTELLSGLVTPGKKKRMLVEPPVKETSALVDGMVFPHMQKPKTHRLTAKAVVCYYQKKDSRPNAKMAFQLRIARHVLARADWHEGQRVQFGIDADTGKAALVPVGRLDDGYALRFQRTCATVTFPVHDNMGLAEFVDSKEVTLVEVGAAGLKLQFPPDAVYLMSGG